MSFDPTTIIPERAVAPARPVPRWTSIRIWSADAVLAAALNVAVVVFIGRYALSDKTLATPEAISVELVQDGPASDQKSAGDQARKGESGLPSGSEANENGPAEAHKPAENAAREPEAPTTQKPDTAEPVHEPDKTEAVSPQPQPPVAGPAPPSAPETATPAPQAKQEEAFVPAPLKTDAQGEAAPHLVQAPPAPAAAAPQAEKPVEANAVAEVKAELKPAAAAAEPAPPPAVQTSADSTDEVPLSLLQPKPPSKPPPEITPAEKRRQAEMTAKLAAALPFSQTFVPDPARATQSGDGEAVSAEYRGAVYASLHKADSVVEAARARNLHGQTVVAFSVDAGGNLTALTVAISSGNAGVDAAALDYIRRSAPFPPPPPGAQRSFSPAIRFGMD